jgi:predicted AlkP superfamily pyrophosphatase or phosphodiesterase
LTQFDEQLNRLKEYRIPGLDFGDEFIYPNYNGRSILNIPDSVCSFLGLPLLSGRPLAQELVQPLVSAGDYQHVILILVDALALHRLQRWMEDGTAPVWRRLADHGILAPLTSIAPSTTSAALTSLWTGRSPTEHAITGYEMWMKEYGVVANTILHAPMNFRDDVGSLSRAGFDPKAFLPFPTLGVHLAKHDVPVFALQHRSIIKSGLSQMFFDEVKSQAFHSASDLWVNLRHLVEDHRNRKLFAYVYWSEVDSFGHRYGPDNERTVAEFSSLSSSFERLFLDRLKKGSRGNTLLILTADHGQLNTSKDPYYEVQRYPSFWRRLHIQPTGENRMTFLYIRPGQMEAVSEFIERNWANRFFQVDPSYAVEKGLFGPGESHAALLDRIGDVILLARKSAYLWWGNIENHLLGRHGGLHPEEMLVPFLAIRY